MTPRASLVERRPARSHDADAEADGNGSTILLSTVSSDAHTWNLVWLQLLLEEQGYTVIGLGPCVPDRLLVTEALEHRPDALVLSTVNGHGHVDGSRAVRQLRKHPELSALPIAIGGKLGITGGDSHGVALIDAGVDAVFADDSEPAALLHWLSKVTANRVQHRDAASDPAPFLRAGAGTRAHA